jgi:hypothetical protein
MAGFDNMSYAKVLDTILLAIETRMSQNKEEEPAIVNRFATV